MRFVPTLLLAASVAALATEAKSAVPAGFEYIDTSFENASPLWYEPAADGSIVVHLLYDHQRSSSNRAAGHLHFLLHAQAGSRLVVEFKNLDNVWNGQPGSVAKELKAVTISQNGRDWRPLATESLANDRIRATIEMPGPRLYVARIEPYRLSDLERLLAWLRGRPLTAIEPIGATVLGRPLEIVRVGRLDAPRHVFVRARAHPWESGGNWVVEGLVRRLLRGDEHAKRCLERYCVHVLPMANKDGVARGLTRFNAQGKDLNRDWDRPADPALAPENAALERWLAQAIEAGRRPHLAIDLHNDGGGQLHVSRPPGPRLDESLARIERFERLLRKYTWFTEGSSRSTFRNPGTLGEGWLERFGIDAVVQELHCNWIAGLGDYPSARHWQAFGEGLTLAFHEFFEEKGGR